ncbi:response regulator [Rubripirellula reticaptiva]|nr:response regulator [Rubripirellula reticaptiva]
MMTPNLLVTDDDAAFRQVLCEALARRGFNVTEATDGQEAMDVLDHSEVHVCLIDFHMPRLTGLDVIRRLHTAGRVLPCVLMSADLNDEIRREAESMATYGVLAKPVRLKQLSDVVCRALADVYGWRPSM